MPPRFTLRQLAYFVTAAEAGTIAAAAEEHFLTNSALSSALADLEKALGAQLLVRQRGKGLELTANGRDFLPRARRLLRDADELSGFADSLQDALHGSLAVGCFDAMSPVVLTPLLAELSRRHPQVRANIRSESQDALLAGVAEGELELAIVYDIGLGADFERDELAQSLGHVLLPASHPAAGREEVSLRDLAELPLIGVRTSPARAMAQIFRLSGIDIVPAMELNNFDLIRSMVEAGLGYTVFSQPVGASVPHWGSGAVAVPIAEDLPPLTIVIVRRRGVRLTRRAEAFRELCIADGFELWRSGQAT